MVSKNQAKLIRSLSQKKFRQKHGLFSAEGSKTVLELLDESHTPSLLLATDDWMESHPKWSRSFAFQVVSAAELGQLSSLKTASGVMGLFEIPSEEIPVAVLDQGLTLLLDQINDPGNLGTILRIADWFGVEHVVCSPNCVDPYNPKCVMATMGSIARIKLLHHNLEDLLQAAAEKMPHLSTWGAFLGGESVYEAALDTPAWLVMGSESHGISDTLSPYIQHAITIPAFGKAESLNVATATAILCSEFRRRHI